MIIDTIENGYKYLNIHKGFKEAFEFIMRSKMEQLPIGHYIINGEDIFANIEEYNTIDSSLLRFEMHKKYIDIHYILEGEESICHSVNTTGFQKDGADNDCYFFKGRAENFIRLSNDTFAIFFPYEKHRPKGNPIGFSTYVKKGIVKIML